MFVQQPFFSGVDLNNDQEICPHICKDHPYACLNRTCQACESIEVEAASNLVDRTYEAICTFFQDLLLRKQGAAFEKLTMHVAGHRDIAYAEVLSVEGQRQQIGRNSHQRTFVYEAKHVIGRPTRCFEKRLVRETKRKASSGFHQYFLHNEIS